MSSSDTPAIALLLDAFDRVHEQIPGVVDGLSADDLTWRPDADANPIGWLVWHLTRVQDDHLAKLSTSLDRPRDQVWADWRDRFDLPYDADTVGYGQSSEEVGRFSVPDPSLLTGYHEAVDAMTREILGELTPDDLGRVVDDAWDPPVTAASRLISVVGDTTAHVGQAQYVQGLLQRR